MGLFDKLFGKKKEDDIANLFKQIFLKIKVLFRLRLIINVYSLG